MARRDHFDRVIAGIVYPFRNGQHHARAHVFRPQARLAITQRRVNELNLIHKYVVESEDLLTTKRTKDTKVSDDSSYQTFFKLRALRALRGK
jgi:hypothetical protein